MPKFRRRPDVVEAEQFHASADPETWPPGVEWGGDRPAGTGGYVVTLVGGVKFPIADGDWVVTRPDGRGYWAVEEADFLKAYEPVDADK